MSEREYAAHSGISRGPIQKARNAGRLVVYADGSINAAASDAADRSRQSKPSSDERGRFNPAIHPKRSARLFLA